VAVLNVHERRLAADPADVGVLLDSLASAGDRLWPRDRWPAMRLDRPLGPSAVGGHGPIRYAVDTYRPGRMVRFRFTAPTGFHGTHGFTVEAASGEGSVLRHELAMATTGSARLTWPLVFRPLHDALIEDALDRACAELGEAAAPQRWPLRVRLLRAVLKRV
jgi:hypothetical protein